MAYQPIQLGKIGALAGMDDLSNAITEAFAMSQQRQKLAAERLKFQADQKQQALLNERQGQMDFQQAYMKAQQLARAGDIAGAQALMAPYNPQQMTRQVETGQRELIPEGDQPLQLQPGSMPGQPPPKDDLFPSGRFGSAQQPKAGEMLIQAAQASRPKMRDVSYMGGQFGGKQWSIDPEAIQQARATRLDEAMAGLDEQSRADYQRIRPALLASNQDLDVTDVSRFLAGAASQRQRGEIQEVKNDQFNRKFAQSDTQLDKKLHQSDVNSQRAADAKIRAAAMMAMPGLKNDAANRGDIARLQAEIKGFFQVADAKGQLKNMNALHAAHANINANGDNTAIAHRDALIQLARFFRGSIPTEGEMKVLYDKIGGAPGAVDAFIEGLKTGDISDAMIANLQTSTKIALAEAEERRKQMFSGLANIAGPQSAFANMGPSVNAMVRGYAQLYGLDDVPDVQPSSGPSTVLGSGTRPTPPRPQPVQAPRKPAAAAAKKKTPDDYLRDAGIIK